MGTMRAGVWIAVVVLSLTGCGVPRELRTMRDLRRAAPSTPLRVMDTDRAIYHLNRYTVLDSMLEGSGTRITREGRTPFTGQLLYRDLVYIQARQGGVWATMGIVRVVACAASWLRLATETHGLTIHTAGGGSCPYIYAWDGDRYALQGEAFGTAFGRALESSTTCMLPALEDQNGTLRVRLTNERPETQYVNQVRLLAFEAPAGAEVLLDAENRAWPIRDRRPPLPTRPGPPWWGGAGTVPGPDDAGHELGGDAAYRDRLELVFARPRGGAAASLVIRAVNTGLVYAAFETVFGYLGEQALLFLDQVENDAEVVRLLREWIHECSLVIDIWQGGRWVPAGGVAPEASVAAFTRLIRVEVPGTAGPVGDADAKDAERDSLRIRLGSLAGAWRIDSVEIDWTPVEPLEARPVVVAAAVRREAARVTAPASLPLGEADSTSVVLLPGDRIDLSFDAVRAGASERVAYALEVRGYLHEWTPAGDDPGGDSTAPATPALDRVAVANQLIRRREVLLPLVYERWRARRVGAAE